MSASSLASLAEQELGLPAPLRPYQWEGVRFLVEGSSALLADDMGLGKTVQVAVALALLCKSAAVSRALIIAPASLRLNWERELRRWAPQVSVRKLVGGGDDRRMYYRLPVNVLIASYEQIRADALPAGIGTQYDLVVLDEAQRIKNAGSDTALACRILRRARSWALSGTPVENRATDLVSILRFVRPGLVHDGLSKVELHERMQPYFLRRRKGEVLGELPPIITQDVPLELGARQREAYDRVWAARGGSIPAESARGSRLQAHLFALITKLKQLCNFDPESGQSAKWEALQVIVESLTAADEKLLVFSQYVETLQWLAPRIGEIMPCEIFHGGMSQDQRDTAVTRFRQQPGPRVMLVSLRAGGTGLNLQEASTVVLFDRWWNPALEAQAINRAHRFGRERVLHVFRFLVEESIEQRIAEVLDAKLAIFEQYVDDADIAEIPPLTREDLLRILDLPAA